MAQFNREVIICKESVNVALKFHLMWIKWHRYHRKPVPTVLHHYRDPTPGKIGERIRYSCTPFFDLKQRHKKIF